MELINLINLYIYKIYFKACYFIAILFSAITFNLLIGFLQSNQIAPSLGSSFMTIVFYMAAESSDMMEEMFDEKVKNYSSLVFVGKNEK